MKNKRVTTYDPGIEFGAASAVPAAGIDIRAIARTRVDPCDDRLNNEVEIAGFGDKEKDAKDDLAAMQEAVAALLEESNVLKCGDKRCKDGTCVFDWTTIGDPKCEELPATKSKKHKINLPKTIVCRQKIRYGCLCDRSA